MYFLLKMEIFNGYVCLPEGNHSFHGDQLLQVRSAGSSELKIFSLASGRLYVPFLLRVRTGWGVGVGGKISKVSGFLAADGVGDGWRNLLFVGLSEYFEVVELEIAREGTQGDFHQTHHASQLSKFTLDSS